MKLPFLVQRNILNAAVTIAVLMPTVAVGSDIARDSVSNPTDNSGIPTFIISDDEMTYWISHTNAELTFIGDGINPLSSRSAQATTVTYCNTRVDDLCGGACTVYTGGATCLHAPDTKCLAATRNVGFCDKSGCTGSCNQLSSCGTHLSGGYCYTPGTNSIAVSDA